MMKNTVKSDIKPFKMYGNLYFVGSKKVSVHIIKTDCGLVMIDSGYPDMYEQILDSMKELNLDPKDICAIFHSHGHIDHYGCTREFKKLSGAKTYISRIDNDIVKIVENFCNRNKISNSTFYMSVFSIYIHKITSLNRFFLAVANRNRRRSTYKTSEIFIRWREGAKCLICGCAFKANCHLLMLGFSAMIHST